MTCTVIDMTWTRVSCCLICSCISWFMHCLILHMSLVVAVLVSHFNASPNLDHVSQVVTGFQILTQF